MTDGRITFRTRTLVLTAVGIVVALVIAIAWVAIVARGATAPRAGETPIAPSPTASSSDDDGEAGSGAGGHGGDGSGGGGSDGGSDGGSGGGGDGTAGGGSNGAPADTTLRFTGFSFAADVDCAGWDGPDKAPISLSWSSANAVAAYWRGSDQQVSSADANTGYPAPVSGDQGDLVVGSEPRGVFQECGHREYYHVVVTLVDANGRTESRTATFRDTSWGGDGD